MPCPTSRPEMSWFSFSLTMHAQATAALLDRLRDGEVSVGELSQSLGAGQQNVSRHLGVLHAAGIVSRRKDGTRVLYSIGDESVFQLCETVCGHSSRSSLRAMKAAACRHFAST